MVGNCVLIFYASLPAFNFHLQCYCLRCFSLARIVLFSASFVKDASRSGHANVTQARLAVLLAGRGRGPGRLFIFVCARQASALLCSAYCGLLMMRLCKAGTDAAELDTASQSLQEARTLSFMVELHGCERSPHVSALALSCLWPGGLP